VLEEFPVGIGRGGKAAGYRDAQLREAADHFAEGSVLSPDPFHIAHPERFEADYILVHWFLTPC
jgi:hypothetical protein